jgi:hypothetical protein
MEVECEWYSVVCAVAFSICCEAASEARGEGYTGWHFRGFDT